MSLSTQPDERQTERLFCALIEQLKHPLLHISHSAELGHRQALAEISVTVTRTLHLLDAYLMSEQQQLALEPVSISSVLYDVAQALGPLARRHNCELELKVSGKYGPVMANKQGLEAGLLTVAQSLLEADGTPHPRLVLSVYKTNVGVSAGVFGDHPELTPTSFRRALRLYGTTRQPLPQTSALNGAGLYVAHSLFEHMDSRLKVAHHAKLTGLAASFYPSAQLQLV